MDGNAQQAAKARELALGLVREFAPEEIELFDELVAAPPPAPKARRRDDPLAFGVELPPAFAPMALQLASSAVAFLGAGIAKQARIEVPAAAASALVDLIRREGERLGLGKDRSAQIADALLASLAHKG